MNDNVMCNFSTECLLFIVILGMKWQRLMVTSTCYVSILEVFFYQELEKFRGLKEYRSTIGQYQFPYGQYAIDHFRTITP